MTLHDEIAAAAGQDAAVYIGADTLSSLVLDALRSALTISVGSTFAVTNPPYVARLVSATTVGGNAPSSLSATLSDSGGSISIGVIGGLRLEVALGASDPAGAFVAFTTIEMLINNLEFEVEADLGRVTCTPLGAAFIPNIIRDANFDAIVQGLGLDPIEAARVEGVLAYSGIQSLVAMSVSTPREIDLRELFPGMIFHGALRASVVGPAAPNGMTALLIIPGQILPDPDAICDCGGVGDGLGPNHPGSATPKGPDNGTINVGGPTVPVNPVLGRRQRAIGEAGVYIPRSLADVITTGPYPAVRVDVAGGGFIKWKATAIVDFQKVGIDFDAADGAIVLSLTCRISISGKIQADFGKLGKVTIANFSADQAAGANHLEIGLYVVIRDGVVYLKPVAGVIDIGPFDVDIHFGSIIGFGGAGDVLNFIFGTILASIVAHRLPGEMRSKLSDYLAKTSWKLVGIGYWIGLVNYVSHSAPNPRAQWDGLPDSLLVSRGFED
jgi:hypothetical protein